MSLAYVPSVRGIHLMCTVYEYKPRYFISLDPWHQDETDIKLGLAFMTHLSVPMAKNSKKWQVKRAASNFFAQLTTPLMYVMYTLTIDAPDGPGVYSRPGVYLVESLAYSRHIIETDFNLRRDFI